jgi:hypothetical protein
MDFSIFHPRCRAGDGSETLCRPVGPSDPSPNSVGMPPRTERSLLFYSPIPQVGPVHQRIAPPVRRNHTEERRRARGSPAQQRRPTTTTTVSGQSRPPDPQPTSHLPYLSVDWALLSFPPCRQLAPQPLEWRGHTSTAHRRVARPEYQACTTKVTCS